MKKLSSLFYLIFLIGCASDMVKSTASKKFSIIEFRQTENLKQFSRETIEVKEGVIDPYQWNKLSQAKGFKKKLGISSFETVIQPTIGGLSPKTNIYLSSPAKQLLTEGFLTQWEKSLSQVLKNKLRATKKIKNSKSFKLMGTDASDLIKKKKIELSKEFFSAKKGKTTSDDRIVMPRKFRDITLMYTPSYEFLSLAKGSNNYKHQLNVVAKENKLSQLGHVHTEMSWRVDPKQETGRSRLIYIF